MIFKFRPNDGSKHFKDWYENTPATPPTAPDCAFYMYEFRAWFYQWVFK